MWAIRDHTRLVHRGPEVRTAQKQVIQNRHIMPCWYIFKLKVLIVQKVFKIKIIKKKEYLVFICSYYIQL